MNKFLSFIINDLKNIKREPMLTHLLLVPFILALLVRWFIPEITRLLKPLFSLTPYYPIIVCGVFILLIPVLFGMISGFNIIDERNNNVLLAILVSPFSAIKYFAYRITFPIIISVLYIMALIPLVNLMSISLLSILPVVVLGATLAPLSAVFLAVFSGSKSEGLAVMKTAFILLFAPLTSFFIKSDWHFVIGVIPTYWPFRAFLIISQGKAGYWGYIAAGAVLNIIILAVLVRYFRKKMC